MSVPLLEGTVDVSRLPGERLQDLSPGLPLSLKWLLALVVLYAGVFSGAVAAPHRPPATVSGRYVECGVDAKPLAEQLTAALPALSTGAIVYEVNEAGQLVRVDTGSGARQVLAQPTAVTSVAQSVVNCDLTGQRRLEPNLLAVTKTDGSVWVLGQIANYDRDAETPRPQLLFDTHGKWIRLNKFSGYSKVVAGETWIAGLNREGTVALWGYHDGTLFPISTAAEQDRRIPQQDLLPRTVFRFQIYIDIMAFNNALYGHLADGQVTAWGGRHVCAPEYQSDYLGGNYICPHIKPDDGFVEKIWRVNAQPFSKCYASFRGGKQWEWPCDIAKDAWTLPGRLRSEIRQEIGKKHAPGSGL